MTQGPLMLGLSHATAPLEVRERIAFNHHRRHEALDALRHRYSPAEAVILSTCNRVEIYLAGAGAPTLGQAASFVAEFHGIDAGAFQKHLYQHDGRDAVEHLFRVASSLDSMVVGESQILGQVRDAYEASCATGMTGPTFNPLFQRAISAGKRVMRKTGIGQGRLSLASVAVDCARQIFDRFGDKTILSIGAGKMATLMLKNLQELNPMRLLVCNRDRTRAQELADRFGGSVADFERLPDHLTEADIVLSSTGSADPIITRALFEPLLKKRRYRPIFLIDIAMPRDVEGQVGQLENVYLYNIDDLQTVVGKTMSQRREAIESARKIVDEEVEDFLAWNRARLHGPMIDQLFARYHALAEEELERTLRKLPDITEAEREHLRELTRRLVNKLLHEPVSALRRQEKGIRQEKGVTTHL